MKETEKKLKVQFALSNQVQEMVNRINEANKIAIKNSVIKQTEQLRKATQPLRDANIRMVKAIQAANVFKDINFPKIAHQNEVLVSQLIKQQNIFKKLQASHLDTVAAFSQSMNRIQPAISILQNIQSINLQNFDKASSNTQLDDSYLTDVENEFFQKLYLYFENLTTKLPKGRITANGIYLLYSAVVSTALLLFAISQSKYNKRIPAEIEDLNESQQVTNQLLENINEVGNNLYPLIEDLAETDEKETIFVTTKESTIRLKPTSESEILDRIPSDQEIEILKNKKRWYYIKYFDFEKSIPKMGYIYKGNVNSLEK